MSFSWVRPLRFSALQLLSFTALILERGQVDVQRVQLRDAILIRALPASLKNTAFLTLYGMIRKVDIAFAFPLPPGRLRERERHTHSSRWHARSSSPQQFPDPSLSVNDRVSGMRMHVWYLRSLERLSTSLTQFHLHKFTFWCPFLLLPDTKPLEIRREDGSIWAREKDSTPQSQI